MVGFLLSDYKDNDKYNKHDNLLVFSGQYNGRTD
jgi:hypothetical protein